MLYANPNTKLNVEKTYSPSRRNRGYLVQIGLTFIIALSLLLAIFSILLQQPAIVLAAGETCFATIEPSVTTTYSSTNATALRDAVAAATAGDVVKVAGTCAGTTTSGGQVVSRLNNALTIRGAYTTTNWITPQPGVYTTTLDAEQNGRVVFIEDADILLENLTLTGGQISGGGSGLYIDNYNNTITISNSIISNNIASTVGGGLYNDGTGASSKVILINTLVHSNTAVTSGGGIYNTQTVSMIVMTNTTISNNEALFGGGIGNSTGGQVMMTNSSISHNTGSNNGGGIDNTGSTSTISMVDTLISYNAATWGGGGISNNTGQVVIANSTISSNTHTASTSSLVGGGISNANGGQVVMTNSTISHNTAPSAGGGIANLHASNVVTMINSTVSYNGVVMIYNGGTVNVRNSIIAHSLSGSNCLSYAGGTVTSTGYSLSSDTSCNFINTGDQQNSNPLLGPLAANGGPSAGVNGEQPMLTHALLSGSPAIDSGYCDLSTDQRSEARPGSFTSACDIGAYEAQGITADVGISKSVTPNTANVGDTITYTLTFSNSGEGLAQNVIITDEIPMEITNIIVSNSGATITPTAGITFAWTVEDLSAGEGGTITLIGQVDPALILDTTVTNTAIITSSTVDASSANNIAQVVLDIRPRPVLHLDKSVFPAAPVAGEQMTYTIQVSNSRTSLATGVIISDVLPSETTYVPGSITGMGGDAAGDPNLTWNVGTVSFGNPITVTFAVTINSNVVTGTQIINTAAVSSSEVLTQVMGSATVIVNQHVDLTVSKSSQREGGIITYTLAISNAGPSAVSGAIVSDTIPTEIETASWMWQCASSGGASCTAGPLNSNIADTVDLPVGGQLIYTVAATLTDPTSTVTNTATVTAPSGVIELIPADNTAVDVSVNNRWFIYLPVILKQG